jgi:stage IV sporulation protein B
VEEFDIQITHLYPEGDGTRSLMLQVTDPELLELTGGIVQGMVVSYNRDNTGNP